MSEFESNNDLLLGFFGSPRLVSVLSDRKMSRDNFALSLMAEDGLFLWKMTNEMSGHDNKAAIAWASIPYYSVVEHETRERMRQTFNVKLKRSDARINEIRNHAKLICGDVKPSSFSEDCMQFVNEMWEYGAWNGEFTTEISLIGDIPLGSTYLLAFQVGVDNFIESLRAKNNEWSTSLGQSNMEHCALNLGLSFFKHGEHLGKAHQVFDGRIELVDMFEFLRVDKSLPKHKPDLDLVAACHLSDYLFIFNALCQLYNLGFLSELLLFKYGLFHLQLFSESVKSLKNYMYQETSGTTRVPSILCEDIMTREQINRIQRLKEIRNALTHYDFSKWKTLDIANPSVTFSGEVERFSGFDLESQAVFVRKAILSVIERLTDVLGFSKTFEISSLQNSTGINASDLILYPSSV